MGPSQLVVAVALCFLAILLQSRRICLHLTPWYVIAIAAVFRLCASGTPVYDPASTRQDLAKHLGVRGNIPQSQTCSR